MRVAATLGNALGSKAIAPSDWLWGRRLRAGPTGETARRIARCPASTAPASRGSGCAAIPDMRR
jgi:hypothetical protein